MNATKESIEIRPATGLCEINNGIIGCRRRATMKLDGHNHCDYHAELAMIHACRRYVTIKRGAA